LLISDEVKIWVALIAALASLVGLLISHFSSRANQVFIEDLKKRYDQDNAEKNARRDYEYDARKRLYEQCGPILFELSEVSEAAYYRITGLAQNSRNGYLEPGSSDSHLKDSYYRLSTLYRIFAPSAALRILQKRLTSVDLSLDRGIWRQYTLARQAFLTFGGEFQLAAMEPALAYKPFENGAETKAKNDPAQFDRQGYPLGAIEAVIETLVQANGKDLRLISYAECEAEYEKEGSLLRTRFDEVGFLIDNFHPRTRPIFWRMLVAQALLYRALFQEMDLSSPSWTAVKLHIPESETGNFDWRRKRDNDITDEQMLEPLKVADAFLQDRLASRLDRINRT
jgi:hypothetical protein